MGRHSGKEGGMRRTIVMIVALAFGIVAYGSTALGADSATPKGEIRFVNVNVCVVAFAFKGFEPGTRGEFEVLMNGHVYRDSFEVLSTKWVRAWRLHKILGDPHPPTLVQYRIFVGGLTA